MNNFGTIRMSIDHIDKLSKDALSCILLDAAVDILNEHEEWVYFARIRLVCKKWRSTVDKYFQRYISAKSCSSAIINSKFTFNSICFRTTLINHSSGQRYKCRLDDIHYKNMNMYGSSRYVFIQGCVRIYFKFKMLKKGIRNQKFKNKACLHINFKSNFISPFYKLTQNTVIIEEWHKQNIELRWEGKKCKKGEICRIEVPRGWKKTICDHLLKYILHRLLY